MATLQSLGTVRLRLRLGGDDYQETLHAVQGDTGRILEFDVLDGDGTIVTDLTGVTPILYIRRPDGQAVGSAEGTISGGVLRIEIPSSLLAYAGEAEAQIQLVDSANQHKLHDHLYKLRIEESLEAGASPGENLWFSLAELTEAIAEVNLLVEQYDGDVAAVSTMRAEVETNRDYVAGVYTQMSDVIDAESSRVTAENARKNAEIVRKIAETGRENAETSRATAESNRNSAEAARIAAETQRGTDEDTRVANETIRQSNEGVRVSQEDTRQTNETIRQSAESTRQSNESGRVSNETARIQQWQTWEDLIEDGVMPNATPTTAGIVRVDALGTENAPYTAVTTGKLASDLTEKVDKVTGKGLSTNDYSNDAKSKVDAIPASPKYTDTVTTINGKTGAITKADITALGIPAQDTVYTHPSAHPASMITESTTRRFVTDSEKSTWNDKANGTHTHDSVQTAQNAALKFSRLTQAAYNALGTKDPNTLYVIVG